MRAVCSLLQFTEMVMGKGRKGVDGVASPRAEGPSVKAMEAAAAGGLNGKARAHDDTALVN